MTVVKHIPNGLTLCNLCCGCAGIVSALEGDLERASLFIWLGAFFDFADGLAARLLDSFSQIGPDLDSLSDMITFGVLPSCIGYKSLLQAAEGEGGERFCYPLAPLAFSVAVFSAIRLARFRNEPNPEGDSFSGLPTTANAIVYSGLPFVRASIPSLIFLFATSSGFLVSTFRFIALKKRVFDVRLNWYKHLYILASGFLLLMWRGSAIFWVVGAYFVASLGMHFSGILP